MKKLIEEFKSFAVKGNFFEMAVGIIIGTSFNKIVTSIVNDLIMPSFGFMIGKVNFKDLKLILQPELKNETGKIINQAVIINYGNFIQVLIDFLIIAITMFIIIKVFNSLKIKSEDTKDKTVPTPKDIELLSEIRDLLKKE